MEEWEGDMEEWEGDMEEWKGDMEEWEGDMEEWKGDMEEWEGHMEEWEGHMEEWEGYAAQPYQLPHRPLHVHVDSYRPTANFLATRNLGEQKRRGGCLDKRRAVATPTSER